MATAVKAPEALALLEFSSIARGSRVLDDVVKKAPVDVHTATPVSHGKYLLIFTGDVGSVDESFRAGLAAGGDLITNKLYLPQVHVEVALSLESRLAIEDVDALAIVETTSMATTVGAADAAAKCANVHLIEIRLGQGIGGKGYFTMTGALSDVEAAVEAAREVALRDAALVTAEIVARPSPELIANLAGEAWRPHSLPKARKA